MTFTLKKWKKFTKSKVATGADAICLGDGKYSVQIGPFRSNHYGVQLSDVEAAEYFAKRN